jgi:site-specific DNA recombinase
MMAERKAKIRRPGKRPVNLFSGLTFCHCANKMYVPSNTPKYVCWKCRNKIPIVDLEAIYYEQLKGFFLSPDEIAKHIEHADHHIAEKEGLLLVLQGEQDKVEEEVQRIYRLYSDGGLTADGFGKFYRPLEGRQKQLEEELPRLQAEVDLLKINHLSSDKILSEAKDLYGRWPQLTRDEKQRIVESMTERIEIGKDEVSITLCHLPTSEELTKEQRGLLDSSRPPA